MKRDSIYRPSSILLQELTQRLEKGDADAIELIYRHYYHRLLYYGVQVTASGNQKEVEDVIQEFFIWLTENGEKVNQVRDFESYMFQSIRRNLQSRSQAEKKSQAAHERYLNRTGPLQESTSSSPEQLHIRQEESGAVKALIQQELNQLPSYLRETLYLRYFEDKSYSEIASILSVSDQVAYNYVFRAIKRLKERLGDLKILLLALYTVARLFFD